MDEAAAFGGWFAAMVGCAFAALISVVTLGAYFESLLRLEALREKNAPNMGSQEAGELEMIIRWAMAWIGCTLFCVAMFTLHLIGIGWGAAFGVMLGEFVLSVPLWLGVITMIDPRTQKTNLMARLRLVVSKLGSPS